MDELLESDDKALYNVLTSAPGPDGSLPLTDQMLRHWPSGHLFGMSQNAGMGWPAREMQGPQVLLLSTAGGIRAPDGSPVALGYHTGHWEVNLLVQAAALQIKQLGGVPFAAFCSDPCDGRTQGTPGMFDSLPFRNDAAVLFGRQIRSLPTRLGVLGVATCDKGLPAMMMALAAARELPTVLVPGGVTLPPRAGEDAAKVQTMGARYAHGRVTLGGSSPRRLHRLCHAGRWLSVHGHGGHLAGRRRGLGTDATPCGTGPQRAADLAGSGRAQRAGTLADDSNGRADRPDPDRRRGPQRHGRPRRLRRLHEPAAAPAGHRFLGRPARAHRSKIGPT